MRWLIVLTAVITVGLAAVTRTKEGTLYIWLVVLRINVDLAIFQPYLDLEAGDNQSLKNSSGEVGNQTPVLLLRKPRA